MLLTPSPCHKLSHLLGPGPSPPSSVTYCMDGPLYSAFSTQHFTPCKPQISMANQHFLSSILPSLISESAFYPRSLLPPVQQTLFRGGNRYVDLLNCL